MIVADAMTPGADLVTVSLPGGRKDALEYLQEDRFSSVPVVKQTDDGEQYRGLVSREDLIANPTEDQLALLMREVPTVHPDDDVREVARVVRETGARRLPVVDGDDETELVGIVTVTDVISAIAHGEVETDATCGEVAASAVTTVYAGAPLTVAERQLAFAEVPYAVCLDDDCEVAGMLTEVDVLDVARIVEGEEATGDSIADQDDDWKWESVKAIGSRYLPTRNVEIPSEPVSRFMTADVLSVYGAQTVREAAQEMVRNDVEQFPLMDGGDLGGVVRDVHLLEAV
ncbi:CBS domain-containing protein [Halobaculum sp. MBLA0147]|uniref:CBS domain-containing protein n=1 Tax=Halobaculum sp. MBLA0147 TaxID=3079934 RepID=UPI003523300B